MMSNSTKHIGNMDYQGKITQKGAYTGNITVGGAYNLYPRGNEYLRYKTVSQNFDIGLSFKIRII